MGLSSVCGSRPTKLDTSKLDRENPGKFDRIFAPNTCSPKGGVTMFVVFRTAVIACLFVALIGCSLSADEPKFITPEELDRLPEGIKVVHEPKTALATLTGRSKLRAKYTWWYKTTVSGIDADVTILEFGAFDWKDGKWVNGRTFTGKPYAAEEFADWYNCPNAVVKKSESRSDPRNWSSQPELRAGKMRWYYVGTDPKGNKVKGEAVIELKAEIDPKKPKDPEN
jgi:hypothetical protein